MSSLRNAHHELPAMHMTLFCHSYMRFWYRTYEVTITPITSLHIWSAASKDTGWDATSRDTSLISTSNLAHIQYRYEHRSELVIKSANVWSHLRPTELGSAILIWIFSRYRYVTWTAPVQEPSTDLPAIFFKRARNNDKTYKAWP